MVVAMKLGPALGLKKQERDVENQNDVRERNHEEREYLWLRAVPSSVVQNIGPPVIFLAILPRARPSVRGSTALYVMGRRNRSHRRTVPTHSTKVRTDLT
jgi:hypothetical protein